LVSSSIKSSSTEIEEIEFWGQQVLI
jgi:hypothetical protein